MAVGDMLPQCFAKEPGRVKWCKPCPYGRLCKTEYETPVEPNPVYTPPPDEGWLLVGDE